VSISVDDNAKEVLFRFLDGIRQAILENMNYSTTIGIGSICGDIGEVHTSYEEARTAYGYKVFLGGGRVISIDDAPGDKDWYYIHPIKIEKGLLQHLREADVRAMLESLAEYLESVMTRSLDPFKLKLVSIHLLDNIITCCLEMGCNIGDALSEERDLYKELLERNDIASVHVWFKRLLVDVAGYMNMRKDEHSKEFVVRIAAYIDENFMRPEICMDSICDHFHFSPSFISRVFREVKGKTVKQYITERRFERAMELIENSNMKIKEIGSCVGYTNTQSFLKIFKRYHGETPREYRSRSVNDPAR
jgi:two-component system response regulator YesN